MDTICVKVADYHRHQSLSRRSCDESVRDDTLNGANVSHLKTIMIRILCRVLTSPRIKTRANHAMADVLMEQVPFSRDFLFRQVRRTKNNLRMSAASVILRAVACTCNPATMNFHLAKSTPMVIWINSD